MKAQMSAWLLIFSILLCSCSHSSSHVSAQTDLSKAATDSDLFLNLKSHNYDAVKNLVERGANVNSRDRNGYTALQLAASDGNVEIMEFLLKRGANPNLEIVEGRHPFDLALLTANNGMIKCLLEAGANPNTKIGDRGVLIDAIIKGNDQAATLFILHGADVDLPNYLGRTALFYVSSKSPELASVLISKGANPNFADKDGITPIFIAIQNTDLPWVKSLIENGADVNAKDRSGWTPMKEALAYGCSNIILYLRQKRAILD